MASGIVEQNSGQSSQQQQQSGSSASAAPANRSQLVQRLLDASSNLPAFVNDLLTVQAVTVAGTEAAGFLIEAGAEPNTWTLRPIAHIRPDASGAEMRAAALNAFQELVKPCIEQNRDGAIEVSPAQDGGEPQFCLVTLLRNEGNVVAASAVVTRCLNVERAKQRLSSMQLVAGYFDLFTIRKNAEQARNIAISHQSVLQYATAVGTAEGFQAAAMSLCNELAGRAHATRVSLGWVKGKTIKVKALSHTEEFDKKQELVVALQRTMEECMDQEAIVHYDPQGGGTDNVTRNAQALSRSQGGHIVLSLPLRQKAEVIGVVTIEFLPQTRINPQISSGLSIAVDLLAPQLHDRYENDRWLITKAGISTKKAAGTIIGPKHMIAKLVTVAVIGLIVFAVLFKPMYRVSAPFTFVPDGRVTLAAPYEGKIGDLAMVTDPQTKMQRRLKPGDPVKAGQVVIEMDTTDLKLETLKAEADYNKARAEWVRISNDNKPESAGEAQVARYKMDEAYAQWQLLNLNLERGKLHAPMDGVLLKGDLEDQKGKPVKQGDELLVVGKPELLEVEMQVAERDMHDVKLGQKVWVATSSLPDDKYAATVTRISQIGEPNKEGNNVFKVHAKLDQYIPTWRPGMAGEGKIEVRQEPIWWIYSHKLIEFVKVQVWKWGI